MGVDINPNELIQTLSTNKKSRIWFIIILLFILFGGTFLGKVWHKPVPVSENCDSWIAQNNMLVTALLDIKRESDSLLRSTTKNPIANSATSVSFLFSVDTLPKRKTTADSLLLYKKGLGDIIKKIDSVLLKAKKVKKN